ncbi:GNAT family protein [Kutzneria viridogrisea]|uniref:N-acetyltransferase domain-containing protein n=2 Tax=Kutzneria TaxID=43356 RepID=W5WHL5_9PSEU|nr:GNAT family protein [Kutzneria albida]AHI00097.1 hypothetical protein KALB_6738 [Kutzneria albida DSM 43870]MBA8925276.1 RimJ/RimL family protein N-acetyltransferase [Kutzneria viridogrisea]
MRPIETERLLLRAFTEDDFEGLRAVQSDPEVTRYLYYEPRSEQEVREALRLRILRTSLEPASGEAEHAVVEHAVVLRETGELIGDVQVALVSAEHRTGEIGFVFHPAHHGRGYAGEAARAVLRSGFHDHGLHRIIGRCDARNTASSGLMERLGMRREAHFVRNEFVKGEWCDELVYAVLAEEWES